MMLLNIDATLRDQLQVIEEVDVDTAQEFCQFALQLLEKGPQPKLLEKAAMKLNWTAEKLQTILEAITELARRSAKDNTIDKEEVSTVLRDAGISPTIAEVLAEFCSSSRAALHGYLHNIHCKTPRLKRLEWRLEVEIASRTVQNSVKPHLLLQLELENSQRSSKVHTLQMDIPTLLHVTEELEQALREVKSTHARKIMRNIK
ncbi:hypothetical protein RvY_13668 [Ramazzottius varieornatus]|uniref:COMM domain-containing protein n=1 Tax=Ramazzottius varieornatus TaxID=947166 RepID=A0A1D1VX76_RAMVA|nr:hypothetical protein RvY_13668 [Ramazzottius varieornatus]